MDRTRIYFVLQIKIGTQMTQINNCTAWIQTRQRLDLCHLRSGLTDKLVFGGMGIIILNNVGNFSI